MVLHLQPKRYILLILHNPERRFVLSLDYNGSKSFLFVFCYKSVSIQGKRLRNAVCLGNVSKDFTNNNMKKSELKRSCKMFFC